MGKKQSAWWRVIRGPSCWFTPTVPCSLRISQATPASFPVWILASWRLVNMDSSADGESEDGDYRYFILTIFTVELSLLLSFGTQEPYPQPYWPLDCLSCVVWRSVPSPPSSSLPSPQLSRTPQFFRYLRCPHETLQNY